MSQVQLRIQELERQTRNALIAQEKRSQKVGKLFWDAQQAERYPNLSENVALASNLETVPVSGMDPQTMSVLFNNFREKLMTMTSNNATVVNYILQSINSREAV